MTTSTKNKPSASADREPGVDELRLSSATQSVRAQVAEAFGAEYTQGKIRPAQRQGAEAVLKLFIEDSDEPVRAAIAEHLATCSHLPLKLASTIAADIDAIALPMIRRSIVFDDDTLTEIVNSDVAVRQIAVAERHTVSLSLSNALVSTGNPDVVATLLANDGARFTSASLTAILEDFGDNPVVVGAVLGRLTLPLETINQLLQKTDMAIGEIIEDALDVPGAIVERIRKLAHEQIILAYVGNCDDPGPVESLAARLAGQQRLTSTLVLRALCTGDIRFFAIALAAGSGGEATKIQDLITQGPYDGLAPVCEACGWTATIHRAFVAVLTLYNSKKDDPLALEPEVFTPKAVDRLLSKFSSISPSSLDSVILEICWKLA